MYRPAPLMCMLDARLLETMPVLCRLPPNVALFALEDNQSSAKALEPTALLCVNPEVFPKLNFASEVSGLSQEHTG